MNFYFIFGPQAVGKMSIGRKLSNELEIPLMHNHMTNELTAAIFGREREERKKLSDKFRFDIFDAVAKSNLQGFVFTLVRAFDVKGDHEYVNDMVTIFEQAGRNVYFIELEAGLHERLRRNKTPLRLAEKPSKRNLKKSEENLLADNERFRLNSNPGEITHTHYLRIDTTHLSVEESVQMIVEEFTFSQ